MDPQGHEGTLRKMVPFSASGGSAGVEDDSEAQHYTASGRKKFFPAARRKKVATRVLAASLAYKFGTGEVGRRGHGRFSFVC